jgi:AGZA family xanthine/uracil permease-like MFS transporter
MSWFGLMHAYAYTPGDTFVRLGLGAGGEWALAYACAAAFLYAVPWIGTHTDSPVP